MEVLSLFGKFKLKTEHVIRDRFKPSYGNKNARIAAGAGRIQLFAQHSTIDKGGLWGGNVEFARAYLT